MSHPSQSFQHLGGARAANDNDLLELRRTLAALDAQRALIDRAQLMELELRTQEQELRFDSSRIAIEERAHIEMVLAQLEDIVGDGWYSLSLDDLDRLAEWVES